MRYKKKLVFFYPSIEIGGLTKNLFSLINSLSKINKLKLKNKVYRSKFIKGRNSEFFNRFMYHDISILYDFLKKN